MDKYISFNSRVAAAIGINEAIMLNSLWYWIDKNKANEKHKHEGKYWTYNSVKAFTEIYPFWTTEKVRNIMRKLKDGGYIETARFNQMKYDQTTWYTLTAKAVNLLSGLICEKSQIDVGENPNTSGENPKPIPSIYQDNKQDILSSSSSTALAKRVIDYLNRKTGKHFKHNTPKTIKCINARVNEGFKPEDFKQVIDTKVAQWSTPDMEQYLRPETLFGTKFEGYLNERVTTSQPKPTGTWGRML